MIINERPDENDARIIKGSGISENFSDKQRWLHIIQSDNEKLEKLLKEASSTKNRLKGFFSSQSDSKATKTKLSDPVLLNSSNAKTISVGTNTSPTRSPSSSTSIPSLVLPNVTKDSTSDDSGKPWKDMGSLDKIINMEKEMKSLRDENKALRAAVRQLVELCTKLRQDSNGSTRHEFKDPIYHLHHNDEYYSSAHADTEGDDAISNDLQLSASASVSDSQEESSSCGGWDL